MKSSQDLHIHDKKTLGPNTKTIQNGHLEATETIPSTIAGENLRERATHRSSSDILTFQIKIAIRGGQAPKRVS